LRGGICIHGVIIAAGKGERMKGLTQTIPKALVPVAGRTLIEHCIERFKMANVQKITIATGWKSDMIRDAITISGNLSDVNIIDVSNYERGPLQTLTTALATIQAEESIICPVDLLISFKAITELITHHSSTARALVTLAVDPNATSGSMVSVTSSGQVQGVQKEVGNADSIVKSAMFMVVSSSFIEYCKNALSNGATTAVTPLNDIIDKNQVVDSYCVHERWFDVDSLADVLEANRYFLESALVKHQKTIFIPSGDTMEIGDTLHLESGIEVGKGVHLKGPCFIQRDTKIGSDSIIGPNASLGVGTSVGNQCEIENAVIFRQSNIPNHSKLHTIVMSASRIHRMEE
jgi:bifunctional UDP-N-acetylglucosamine pyrophosphorylase/glucosamine-1-phosphate N-acetyltransferase